MTMKLFWRFFDSAMYGAKQVITKSFDYVLAALVFLLSLISGLLLGLLRLIEIKQPGIKEPRQFLKKQYRKFFYPRPPEYHMIASDPDHLKYLVLLEGVADFHHINFEIREDSELFVTAERLVHDKFQNVQRCIPLPPGGNFKKETTETFFDEKSCIFTIQLKDFECLSFFSVDSEEEEEAFRLPIPNGKPEAKKVVKETKKEEKSVAANKKDAKQGAANDKDISEEEEKEETPKKPQSGEKRQNESAIKAPTTDKKAEMTTPHKTDGKKATPHPSKEPDKSSQKSDGTHSCKTCKRNFKTDGGLQAHIQAKHTSK